MRSILVSAVLAFSALMPAASGADEVALPPFYAKAMTLSASGPLGTVVAKEAVETAIPGAEAWRIAYVSSDAREKPTLSTALVIAPTGPAPVGGRPIVAWAHGTTGTAQNCGPSQVFGPAVELNQYFLVGGTSWTDFGVPAATRFIKAGYVLVATDYQGLGAGGHHQYAVAATQARDVINSIRAVGSLGLSGSSRKAVVYGWSQGGGATIAAAGLGPYIAAGKTAFDGIDIVGFVAMAPDYVAAAVPAGPLDDAAAAKLVAGFEGEFSDNIFDFTHFAMNMWGMQAAFAELKLTDVFTAEGAADIDAVVSRKCIHVASDTFNFAYAASYKTLLQAKPANVRAWASAMIEGSVAPVKPVAPVILYWGTNDISVPPLMGKLYREKMCALGGNVERVQLSGEQNHFTTPGVAEPLYVPWIAARFAGTAPADGCAG